MDTVVIKLFRSAEEAEDEFGYWKAVDNANAVLIGPTDDIEIEGKEAGVIKWASGEEQDWYIVMFTPKTIKAGGSGVTLVD